MVNVSSTLHDMYKIVSKEVELIEDYNVDGWQKDGIYA